MSTLELQLPSTYVDIEKNEMDYIDGGFYYLSYDDVCSLVGAMGLTTAGVTAVEIAAALGGSAGVASALIPGIGWAAAVAIGANGVAFGWACVNAIAERKGVDISFGFPTGLKFTVK